MPYESNQSSQQSVYPRSLIKKSFVQLYIVHYPIVLDNDQPNQKARNGPLLLEYEIRSL